MTVNSFSITTEPHDHEYTTKQLVKLAGTGYENYWRGEVTTRTSMSSPMTGIASPQTSALGNGQAFDITPSYYSVHMWLRLT